MATTTAEAGPAPGTERLRRLSLTQRILARPAAGALIIVVFVWLVFAAISLAKGNLASSPPSGTLNYLDVAAQVGIIGTSVALLMIAGEFDLSIGSIVGFAGIVIGIGVDHLGPAGLAVDRHVDGRRRRSSAWSTASSSCALASRRSSSRWRPCSSSAASPSVLTSRRHEHHLHPDRSQLSSRTIRSPACSTGASPSAAARFKVSIMWWLLIAAIGTTSWPDSLRQLDRRRRRLGERRAQPRCPGRTGQDPALRADGVLGLDPGHDPEHDLLLGRHPAGPRHRARRHHHRGHRRHAPDRRLRLRRRNGARRAALGMARQGIVFADINADWYKIAIGTLLLVAVVLNNWIRRRFAGL